MIDITPEEHKALYDALCSIAEHNFSKIESKSFCMHTPLADILITFK